jgi:hypothetical protein
MKKCSRERREWLDKQVRLHGFLLRRKANIARRGEYLGRIKAAPKTSTILIPAVLVAEKYEHRCKILDVVEQCSRAILHNSNRVKLDFSKVQKIFPGGMLVLLGALEHLIELYPGRISARCPPKSLSAQLLRHFGIADKLGVSAPLSQPTAASVVEWRYLTGTQAMGEDVSRLLDSYRQSTNAGIPEDLFSVLTEGLINVRHHAYPPASSLPPNLRKWWLFARYVEPEGKTAGNLFISIYDMGVGIPATMRERLKRGELLLDFIEQVVPTGNALDKALLKQAVDHRRSGTGLPHRGNGLPEMREFVASTASGRLYIVSGNVQYSYGPGFEVGSTSSYPRFFPGTLILWSLPLSSKVLQT